MALSPGTRLGPYEILALIGAGGMGEVYQAKDNRLDRDVAIKVLPPHAADLPEGRLRFEREAKAISSLNHPNICRLYDIGREGDVDYLVLEYIEGETLSARLARTRMPREEVLRTAIEIAGALDFAHRKGVVHRDLKPGNIMFTPSGAKLLDFGLAKLREQPALSTTGTPVATVTKSLTAQGALLGTFQYMAPEQLEGKDADARSDIFAFGSVLFESLEGRKAFDANSQAGLIAAILTSEPILNVVSGTTEPALARLILKCMSKRPEQRWQTAADLRDELQWIAGGEPAVGRSTSEGRAIWPRLGWQAVIFLIAVTIGWLLHPSRPPVDRRVSRLSVSPPDGSTFAEECPFCMAISPDGTQLVFLASTQDKVQLWVRRMDTLQARPLPGTDGAAYPFWSPNSQEIGFFADRKLKRLALTLQATPAPPVIIADAPAGRGATWNRDGIIVFAPAVGAVLHRVPATGGQPIPITTLNSMRHEDAHYWPQFLPDGRHILYLARSSEPQNNAVAIANLEAASSQDSVRILQGSDRAVFATDNPSSRKGYLLFVREGTLLARPFDPEHLRFSGEPLPLARDVGFAAHLGVANVSASQNGVLVYASIGKIESRLTWLTREGAVAGTIGAPGLYRSLRLSPDGKRVAVEIIDPQTGVSDIWLLDVLRGVISRFAFHPRFDGRPVWSPAGDAIVFSSDRVAPSNLYRKPTTGAAQEERLTETNRIQHTTDWSRDGRHVMYQQQEAKTKTDLWIVENPLGTPDKRKTLPYLETQFNESQGQFSPDGRYVAYTADDTNRNEIYVQTFPASSNRWQVSNGGGSQPRWAADGKELFYVAPGGTLMSVSVRHTASSFEAGVPKPMFQHRSLDRPGTGVDNYYVYDVDKSAQRFLLVTRVNEFLMETLTVVLNWTAETEMKLQ